VEKEKGKKTRGNKGHPKKLKEKVLLEWGRGEGRRVTGRLSTKEKKNVKTLKNESRAWWRKRPADNWTRKKTEPRGAQWEMNSLKGRRLQGSIKAEEERMGPEKREPMKEPMRLSLERQLKEKKKEKLFVRRKSNGASRGKGLEGRQPRNANLK